MRGEKGVSDSAYAFSDGCNSYFCGLRRHLFFLKVRTVIMTESRNWLEVSMKTIAKAERKFLGSARQEKVVLLIARCPTFALSNA